MDHLLGGLWTSNTRFAGRSVSVISRLNYSSMASGDIMSHMNPTNAFGNNNIDAGKGINVAHAVHNAELYEMAANTCEAAFGLEIISSTS